MTWLIVAEPVGGNENDENTGGIALFLQNDMSRKEISRVAFVRRFGANPTVKFEDALQAEADKAKKSVELLNELAAKAGELQ